MKERKLDLQSAIDLVGKWCLECLCKLEEDYKALPSWDPEVDHQVSIYIEGLRSWIVGNTYWSFTSGRYFGTDSEVTMQHRVVHLTPQRSPCMEVGIVWYVQCLLTILGQH